MLLFGDGDLDEWPSAETHASGEPWASFVRARAAPRSGDVAPAEQVWVSIAAMEDGAPPVEVATHAGTFPDTATRLLQAVVAVAGPT